MSSVLQVANNFIRLAREQNNQTLDLLKLQKLCFIAYGRYLARTGTKLFKEHIEAWKYGPVIPDLYSSVDEYNLEDINRENFIDINKQFPVENMWVRFGPWSQVNLHRKVINDTWNEFANSSGIDLVNLTHQKGTPWERSYKGGFGNIIPDNLIREYYLEELQHRRNNNE